MEISLKKDRKKNKSAVLGSPHTSLAWFPFLSPYPSSKLAPFFEGLFAHWQLATGYAYALTKGSITLKTSALLEQFFPRQTLQILKKNVKQEGNWAENDNVLGSE